MPTFSWQKTFVDNSKPYINAEFLNSLQASMEDLYASSALQFLNTSSSSGKNYDLDAVDDSVTSSPEKPFMFSFIPNQDNEDNATVTLPFDDGKTYPIYSTETGEPIEAGVLKKNSAVYMVVAKNEQGQDVAYVSYGIHLAKRMKRVPGYFDDHPVNQQSPLVGGIANNLNYNGTMHAVAFYGAVYNPASADFAEGYPVVGEYQPGDVIAINPDGTYSKNTIFENNRILGIVSDEYAVFCGTSYGETPIAECGRVHAKVHGTCFAGDYLVADGDHLVCHPSVLPDAHIGTIIAQALEPKYTEQTERILVRIYRR